MRILLLLEPYPIRDSTVEFVDLCLRFARSFASGAAAAAAMHHDLKIYAQRETIGYARKKLRSNVDLFLWPSNAEQEWLENWRGPWVPEGLAAWREIILGHGRIIGEYRALLSALHDRFPFDLVVFWGSNGALRDFCVERGLGTVFLEFGCSRPPFLDTIIADPLGSNGAALVRQTSIAQIHRLMQDRARPAFVDLAIHSAGATVEPYDIEFAYSSNPMLARLQKESRKLLVVPLQLPDDANLIAYSAFSSLSEVVRHVISLATNYGWSVAFKPHPNSHLRLNGLAEVRRARALALDNPHVSWLDSDAGDLTTARLIALGDAVITVNSSVGFEALFYDKPVALLGDAVYGLQGALLTPDELLSGQFDRADYVRRIAMLRAFMLDVALVERGEGMRFPQLIDRILGVHEVASRCRSEPDAYAEALLARFGRETFQRRQQVFLTACRLRPGDMSLAPVKFEVLVAAEPSRHARTPVWRLARWGRDLFRRWELERVVRIVRRSDLFDAAFYVKRYPEVAAKGLDPARHFVVVGWREGRDPSPFFSTQRYIQEQPSVHPDHTNPLLHYIKRRRKGTISWSRRLRRYLALFSRG